MRIVLSGYYGFDNVGDEAILYAITQSLKEYYPKIEIVVLSNKPEKTAATYGVESVNRWNIAEVAKAIKAADGLISGGGSLLQDETGRKSIPYYSGVMKIAQFLRKPVFVYAQGMGPVTSRINKMIMKKTLQAAKLLTVRDESSKQLLKEIGIKQQIQIVPDPVMGLDASNFHSGWLDHKQFSGRVITVSIRDWTEDLSYLEKVAEALDQLSKKGHNIVLVPMHGKHDLKTSERVTNMMIEEVHIFPYDHSIQEKMAVIKESDVLLGMRLHALIFASVGLTPFIALSYDPKIDSFASIVDQPVIGNVNERNWSSEDIVFAIEKIFADYPGEVSKLKKFVVPLQKQADDTAKRVIDLLFEPLTDSKDAVSYSERSRIRNR
ncbi:polysaccharide pyruvyl transferase CsaB [Planococcus shenhongbingii]|nr:polysaccharide pyruvyl transferase CsaB [Planococcus sp. N016]WKA57839.1 polysaccharide pyruvyl transferase CsaB [Planococcus sp. N016]